MNAPLGRSSASLARQSLISETNSAEAPLGTAAGQTPRVGPMPEIHTERAGEGPRLEPPPVLVALYPAGTLHYSV